MKKTSYHNFRSKKGRRSSSKVIVTKKGAPVKPPDKNLKLKYKIVKQVCEILPDPPFAIGITKELFETLKVNYDGKRTVLRKTIKTYMKYRTNGKQYLKALIRETHRNSIDGAEHPIDDEHKRYAKKLLRDRNKKKRGKNYDKPASKNQKRARKVRPPMRHSGTVHPQSQSFRRN